MIWDPNVCPSADIRLAKRRLRFNTAILCLFACSIPKPTIRDPCIAHVRIPYEPVGVCIARFVYGFVRPMEGLTKNGFQGVFIGP